MDKISYAEIGKQKYLEFERQKCTFIARPFSWAVALMVPLIPALSYCDAYNIFLGQVLLGVMGASIFVAMLGFNRKNPTLRHRDCEQRASQKVFGEVVDNPAGISFVQLGQIVCRNFPETTLLRPAQSPDEPLLRIPSQSTTEDQLLRPTSINT